MLKLDREQPTGKGCIKMLPLVSTQTRYIDYEANSSDKTVLRKSTWLHSQQKSSQILISLTNGTHGHLVSVLAHRLSSKEMSTVKLKLNGSTVVMYVLFQMVNGLNIQETVTCHRLTMSPTHILHFLDLIHSTKCSSPMHLFSHSSEIGKSNISDQM